MKKTTPQSREAMLEARITALEYALRQKECKCNELQDRLLLALAKHENLRRAMLRTAKDLHERALPR